MEQNISPEDKTLVLLSYGIFFPSLVILMSDKKKDQFLAYHAWQSLVLWIAMIIVYAVINFIFSFLWFFFFIPIIDLAIWLYAWYCGYEAFQGKYVKIPVVTDIANNLHKGTGGTAK